eukprot:5903219-Pyramimonas_sp.AAC.4
MGELPVSRSADVWRGDTCQCEILELYKVPPTLEELAALAEAKRAQEAAAAAAAAAAAERGWVVLARSRSLSVTLGHPRSPSAPRVSRRSVRPFNTDDATRVRVVAADIYFYHGGIERPTLETSSRVAADEAAGG